MRDVEAELSRYADAVVATIEPAAAEPVEPFVTVEASTSGGRDNRLLVVLAVALIAVAAIAAVALNGSADETVATDLPLAETTSPPEAPVPDAPPPETPAADPSPADAPSVENIERAGSWPIRARLPDGTRFDVWLEGEPVEDITMISAAIIVEFPDGTSPVLGITTFAKGSAEGTHETARINGNRFSVSSREWTVSIGVYPEIKEQLGPDANSLLIDNIKMVNSSGLPALDLSGPFRFATDDEIPLQMLVGYQTFAVRRGCSDLAVACSSTRAVEVVPLDELASQWRPMQAESVSIFSLAPRPVSDPARIPTGPLPPRGAALIAWTGTEVLIYGGTADGSPAFNDGALYSPSTGQWRPTSPPPALTGSRSGGWTGTELMVVSSQATSFYNPETDQWRTVDARVGEGAFVYTDTAYVWGAAGVHRFDDDRWTLLPPLPDRFSTTIEPWRAHLLDLAGDVVAVSTSRAPNCEGRRLARFDGSTWTELAPIELESIDGSFQDCSFAYQVGVAGGRLVAWESNHFNTAAYDADADVWIDIDTIPINPTEGSTGGLAIGEDLLVPQFPASILDGETMQWRAADLPGAGGDLDMAWTGSEVIMWGAECCYGTGGSLSSVDAWTWTPG